MQHADVVIAAEVGDAHGDQVAADLERIGINALRLTASSLHRMKIDSKPDGPLELAWSSDRWLVDGDSTVWWRRPGVAEPEGLDPLERRLVVDEIAALLPGILSAAQVRWVDAPWTLLRARLKVLQLATARRMEIPIPASLVTGDPEAAQDFAARRRIVAKAISSGRGIAPFVGLVPPAELGRVSICPTLLQEYVTASSDARVVTIGDQMYAWVRPRSETQPPDWRFIDPSGVGFEPVSHDPTLGSANRLAREFGLSFSVQDWLLTPEKAIFLEVNPQGQWLFLSEADRMVGPSLAQHLAGHDNR